MFQSHTQRARFLRKRTIELNQRRRIKQHPDSSSGGSSHENRYRKNKALIKENRHELFSDPSSFSTSTTTLNSQQRRLSRTSSHYKVMNPLPINSRPTLKRPLYRKISLPASFAPVCDPYPLFKHYQESPQNLGCGESLTTRLVYLEKGRKGRKRAFLVEKGLKSDDLRHQLQTSDNEVQDAEIETENVRVKLTNMLTNLKSVTC